MLRDMEHEEAERWIELNYDDLKKWREEKPHINWSNFRKGDNVKVMYVFLDELERTIARIRFYRGVILKNLKHTLELECWEKNGYPCEHEIMKFSKTIESVRNIELTV